MAKYRNPYTFTMNKSSQKSHRALKITLGVLIGLIIVVGAVFAFNYKSIMLAIGKSRVRVDQIPQLSKSISSTGVYGNVQKTTDADGSSVLTSASKDGAVSLKVTQAKNGQETVHADVNLKKLDTGGVSKSDLMHGNPSAIQQAKAQADKYITPIMGKDQATGIEAYLITQLYSQYKSNPNNIQINHDFGGTNLSLSGDMSAGNMTVDLKK